MDVTATAKTDRDASPTGPSTRTARGGGRIDFEVVSEIVAPGARVLDLGCGDGSLLQLLVDRKQVIARGVEISVDGVRQCVSKGLSVHQADLDEGLGDYPDGAFDYVILSQTLQTVHRPQLVLREMLRVGRVGIVTFPNFGFWKVRSQLLLTGRMPKNDYLPYEWYNTPNIHLLTVADFQDYCRQDGLGIVRAVYLNDNGRVSTWPNFRAKTAVFEVKTLSESGS